MPTAYILAALIALCPIFCEVVEVAVGSHSHAGAHASTVPSQCPETSDNCICHGAVVSSADGKVFAGSEQRRPGCDVDPFGHSPHYHTARLAWDGSPTGLAALGDSLTVRSYLQNFRC